MLDNVKVTDTPARYDNIIGAVGVDVFGGGADRCKNKGNTLWCYLCF